MDDLLGYRRLLGIIIPNHNTVTLPDFYRANLTGVTAHSSDYAVDGGTDQLAAIEDAARRMKARDPVSVCLAVDEIFFQPNQQLDSWWQGADLAGAYRPDLALVNALSQFAGARLAVISPFPAEHHRLAVARIAESGLHVTSDCTADIGDPRKVAQMSYVRMRELYKAVVESGSPDVVVQLGHNMPLARLVSNLEEDHGRPVLAINSVLMWKMLRDAGIYDPIPGLGKLLFNF